MKLKLLLNIGKQDNEKLGLDKTLEGETVNVTDQKIADFLIAKGWAAHDGDVPETTPARAQAVGDRPPTTSAANDEAAAQAKKEHRK